jgi:hypothetical protein
MAVGASVLAATKKFGTSFLSQQLLDPRGSIRRRRSPWTHSTTPRLSSSPGTILSSFVSFVPGGGHMRRCRVSFFCAFRRESVFRLRFWLVWRVLLFLLLG